MPEPTLRTALASELKRLRGERKFSQATLAAASGVKQATISDIERESGNPTVDTIDLLSNALNATPDFRLQARRRKNSRALSS